MKMGIRSDQRVSSDIRDLAADVRVLLEDAWAKLQQGQGMDVVGNLLAELKEIEASGMMLTARPHPIAEVPRWPLGGK